MPTDSHVSIVTSDHWDNGLIIAFSDGQAAFYPAALLYASLPQAQELPTDYEAGNPPHAR